MSEIYLRVRFNNKLHSIILNDYRIGGCKWNDIEYGECIEYPVNKEDIVIALGIDKTIADLQSQLNQANERLKDAIVPKFKLGQKVFIVDKDYFKIIHYKIAHCKVLGIEDKLDRKNNYVRWYTLKIYNSSYETDRRYRFKEKDVFATEQEAQEKLKEIQGNE